MLFSPHPKIQDNLDEYANVFDPLNRSHVGNTKEYTVYLCYVCCSYCTFLGLSPLTGLTQHWEIFSYAHKHSSVTPDTCSHSVTSFLCVISPLTRYMTFCMYVCVCVCVCNESCPAGGVSTSEYYITSAARLCSPFCYSFLAISLI